MHSPTFPGTFSSIFIMYICVGTLQNIYFFNMKDYGHFQQMQFPFSLFEKIKGFNYSFGLICRYITYKLGVWGSFRAPKAVELFTFKYAFSHFYWYFSSEKLPYIHVGTSQYYFTTKESGHFDKFLLGLICRYINM